MTILIYPLATVKVQNSFLTYVYCKRRIHNAFCVNSQRLLVVNYTNKALHLRCLTVMCPSMSTVAENIRNIRKDREIFC